jgi:chromosome segregation ATPase
MKTNTLVTLLVAGAMSFTACTNKIDEKTVSEINQFGNEWTALGERATNWSSELNQTTERAKEFAAQQTALMNNVANSKDEATKTKVNELATRANQDAERLSTIETEFTTFKTTWDQTNTEFSAWREKVTKGQISTEEATKGIAEFKAKMSDAQAKLDSWNTTYAETKSSCEQNMAMAQTITPEQGKKQ